VQNQTVLEAEGSKKTDFIVQRGKLNDRNS
jgi:hypothetical protein